MRKWGLLISLMLWVVSGVWSQEPHETGYILFVSNREANEDIYITDATRSITYNLTENSARTWHPSWSADGLRIAYNSDQEGNEEIYVMQANGLDQRNVTNNPSRDLSPDWSPVRDEIVFLSDRDGGFDLYRLNLEDEAVTRLTDDGAIKSDPAWSPDGNLIAFWQQMGDALALVLLDVASGELTTLVDTGQNFWPAWSPDGERIAYFSNSSGTEDIYIIELDSGVITNLTQSASNDSRPDWSADGSQIVFMSDRDGNQNLYIMNADGSDPVRLTEASPDDTSPVWQPLNVEVDFAANPLLGLGALQVQGGEIDPEDQEVLGSGVRRLFAPEEAYFQDAIRIRFEIELDDMVVAEDATPAPTPDIPLRDEAALQVYRYMGAEITGLDLEHFDMYPNPSGYLLQLREDEVNYWEWILRPTGQGAIGTRYLAVRVYLPAIQDDGTIIQEEVALLPFDMEILPVEPEEPSDYTQDTVQQEPTQGFSIFYSGGDLMAISFSQETDVSDMTIATDRIEIPILWDFPDFEMLNNLAPPNTCVYYEREGIDPPTLPRACRGNQVFSLPLIPGDVFWFDTNADIRQEVIIRKAGEVFICSAAFDRCDF